MEWGHARLELINIDGVEEKKGGFIPCKISWPTILNLHIKLHIVVLVITFLQHLFFLFLNPFHTPFLLQLSFFRLKFVSLIIGIKTFGSFVNLYILIKSLCPPWSLFWYFVYGSVWKNYHLTHLDFWVTI